MGLKPSGGFRLLLCERIGQYEAGLALSKKSFLHMEDTFELSPATLPSLFSTSGVYSKQYKLQEDKDNLEVLQLIIKVPQKVEIANSLLSLSHNFETRWTTALICGEGVVRRQYDAMHCGFHLNYTLALVQSSVDLWAHPLFLPAVALQNCCFRKTIMKEEISRELGDLENDIGVTLGGQARPRLLQEEWPGGINIKSATIRLHSIGAHIVFISLVTSWTCDFIRFLLDMGEHLDAKFSSLGRSSMVLQEYLAHELSSMSSVDRFVKSYKERVQAQTNVVSSVSNLPLKVILMISLSSIALLARETVRLP